MTEYKDSLPELVELIERHNRLYWEKGEPEISDAEYDLLLRRLESLDPKHPLLSRVHAPVVVSSGKVRHSKPMLSLNKAYSLEELLEWAGKHARNQDELFLIQPKYDGISANFANGVLATRGDGEEGENVTDKLPLIELETLGKTIKMTDRNLPVRGEIVIRDDDFKNIYSNIKKKDGNGYKNSRNAVSGIMGLKEIDDMLAQKAKLTLVDYDLICYQVKLAEFADKWPFFLSEIEALPYPMDGIVIKIADKPYSESLGNTAHHPRGQIAFKFSGVRKNTRLLNVDWSFGKNCLTPVAELDAVDIGGITIRHATLHNAQNIIDKDIWIGDTVTVERAGDVIPYIIAGQAGVERKPALIEFCPCCGFKLERQGPELSCLNPDCFETKVQRLLAAVRNIGIERLGEPNIRKMMTALNVKTLKDIFNLQVLDIIQLEGFKEKSSLNLFNEIQNARNVADFEVLAALNIAGIGKTLSKSILSHHPLDELRGLNQEQLAAINGVGPERATALERELRDQGDFLDELLDCVQMTETKNNSEDAERPTVCFTGKMPEKRSFYENLARERGFEAVSQVTSQLSLLVAADPEAGGGKLSKAKKAGVEIMALADWLTPEKNDIPEEDNNEFSDLPLFQ